VNCLRLMHETTASALAYGIFKDIKKEFKEGEPTYTMFVDIGCSQYAVSVVEYTPQKLRVLSNQFDAELGGRDFDFAIAEWAEKEFVAKFKNADSPKSRPKSWLKLLIAAEKVSGWREQKSDNCMLTTAVRIRRAPLCSHRLPPLFTHVCGEPTPAPLCSHRLPPVFTRVRDSHRPRRPCPPTA